MCVFENTEVEPYRATGTGWIAHKIMALNNFLNKYGLYTLYSAY